MIGITQKFALAVFVVFMVAIVGTNNAYAHHIDYVQQIQIIFEEHERLQTSVNEDQQSISESEFSKAEIAKIQKMIKVKEKRISSLWDEIKELEQLNIESYEVEPNVKDAFDKAQNALEKKFQSSKTFPSNEPVLQVIPDFQHGKIILWIDQDMAESDKKLAGSIENQAKNIIKNNSNISLPVEIVETKIENSSCYSRTYECDPLIGGISVAKIDVNSLNTIGYKAVRNGVTGFVMAGHSAVNDGAEIVQAHNQNNNEVGIVTGFEYSRYCDCAFVDVDESERDVIDDIYRTSTTIYDIAATTNMSQMTVGQIVWKSGVGSGLTVGDIYGLWPNQGKFLVDGYSITGDSGSPVFAVVNGNADLFGMLVHSSGSGYWIVQSQEQIEDRIDAVASTS